MWPHVCLLSPLMGPRGAALGAVVIGLCAIACGATDTPSDGDRDPNASPPAPAAAPASPPPAAPADPSAPVKGTFPKDFVFGSAIAGFQVDMGCPTIAAAEC